MQVQQTNNVQFGARFISSVPVKVKTESGKWIDNSVNFIKLETSKKTDVKALENLESLWGGKNLSSGVAEEARILGRKSHVYALTKQSSNFNNVNHRDILGVMTTDSVHLAKGDVSIFKIGTDPMFAYEQNGRHRQVKHIAKSMLRAFVGMLQKNKDVDSVVAHSDIQDTRFLQRLKFNQTAIDKFELSRENFGNFTK